MPSASIDHVDPKVAKAPGVGWPAIILGIVLLEVACFYGFAVFMMDGTHLWWMSANAGAFVFGPMIWKEYCGLRSKGASLRERHLEKDRAAQRRKHDEFMREAQRAERERQAELRREAERQRRDAEVEHEGEKQSHQRRREPAIAQDQTHWSRVLEVAPSATKDEIARNYRRKIQQCHPDRVAGLAPEFVQLAEERTKALNLAYEQARRKDCTG